MQATLYASSLRGYTKMNIGNVNLKTAEMVIKLRLKKFSRKRIADDVGVTCDQVQAIITLHKDTGFTEFPREGQVKSNADLFLQRAWL